MVTPCSRNSDRNVFYKYFCWNEKSAFAIPLCTYMPLNMTIKLLNEDGRLSIETWWFVKRMKMKLEKALCRYI